VIGIISTRQQFKAFVANDTVYEHVDNISVVEIETESQLNQLLEEHGVSLLCEGTIVSYISIERSPLIGPDLYMLIRLNPYA